MRQFKVSGCYIFTALLLLTSLSSCGRKAERQVAPQLQGLYDQLNSSCTTAKVYEKRVIDLNITPSQTQDSLFSLSEYVEDPLLCPLSLDLSDAYSQYFEQEGLIEYFTSSQSGDTLIGTLKPEYKSSIELHKQKILISGNTVIYFETYNSKRNWLYGLDLQVKVFFDDDGLYKRHSLDIYNTVPLLKEEFRSRIEGKAQYP